MAGSTEAAAVAGLVIGAGRGGTASQGLKGKESRVIITGPTFQDNEFSPGVIEWLKLCSLNERRYPPAPSVRLHAAAFGCGSLSLRVGVSPLI